MHTRNVNLTDVLDQFVATTIASGRYENASEVVRAGLRMLQVREQAQEQYLTYLRGEATVAFAELDQNVGVRTTPDELMDEIEQELGINLVRSVGDALRYTQNGTAYPTRPSQSNRL